MLGVELKKAVKMTLAVASALVVAGIALVGCASLGKTTYTLGKVSVEAPSYWKYEKSADDSYTFTINDDEFVSVSFYNHEKKRYLSADDMAKSDFKDKEDMVYSDFKEFMVGSYEFLEATSEWTISGSDVCKGRVVKGQVGDMQTMSISYYNIRGDEPGHVAEFDGLLKSIKLV